MSWSTCAGLAWSQACLLTCSALSLTPLLLAAGNHDFGDGPNTAACDLHSVAPVLSTMVDDKIDYLWSTGKAFEARVFTALKPWLMRGLPTSEETDKVRAATTSEEDVGESKAGSGNGGEGGDCTSGGKSGLAAARELFRWRDDETESAETERTGIGLLFWSSLSDNVEAVLELAKEAAANMDGGGSVESNKALCINRPDLFGTFIKGTTALHMAVSFASWPVVEALLAMGANPTAKLMNGYDTIMLMSWFGRTDNITRWSEGFPEWDFLRRAEGAVGITALAVAIMFGPNKLETVKTLVKAGANTLALQSDVSASFFTHVAINKDADKELVRYVLELPGIRALVNKSMRGRILKWKVMLLAARLLVKMGTKKAVMVQFSEWLNATPLMHAALSGNAAVMRVLVEEGGADTQLRNARGHTALDVLVGGVHALEETRVLLGAEVKGKGEEDVAKAAVAEDEKEDEKKDEHKKEKTAYVAAQCEYFSFIDLDDSGTITKAKAKAFIVRLLQDLDDSSADDDLTDKDVPGMIEGFAEEGAQCMMEDCDTGADGVITKEKFLAIMLRRIERGEENYAADTEMTLELIAKLKVDAAQGEKWASFSWMRWVYAGRRGVEWWSGV